MPIFEYRCEACESSMELLVRADARPRCPACGSPNLRRLLSVPAPVPAAGRATAPSACDLPPGPGGCCGGGCNLN